MSELLWGHFPTGLEKDYTVAGNSRGCWFPNPFYSAFVSAFSCVLPLGWARRKSVLTGPLISMHETNISRVGIHTDWQQSIWMALGVDGRQCAAGSGKQTQEGCCCACIGVGALFDMGRGCLQGRARGSQHVRGSLRCSRFSRGKQGRSFIHQWKEIYISCQVCHPLLHQKTERVFWPFHFSAMGPNHSHRERIPDFFFYCP